MKKQNKFSSIERLNSFKYAFNGLKILFRTEHNVWIHAFFALLAIALGFVCTLSVLEWCVIIFSIGFVFVAEIINTSIEYITDFISPNFHEQAKKIKDLAAASVLISSLISFVVGILIFFPKLICFLN